MRKSYVAVIVSVALVCGFIFVTTAAAAEKGEKAANRKQLGSKATAQKGRGGTGTDENIKDDTETNNPDPQAQPAAPPEKGGEKGRAAGDCYISFDNWTPLRVRAYVNGVRVGTVSPWGTASGYQPGGTLTLYGKAVFTDGSELTWGPESILCLNASYRWQLTP